MPKHGKKFTKACEAIDGLKMYDVAEAVELVLKSSYAKFDETVDVAVNLPGSSAPAADRPQDPLWLTFTAERDLLLDETPLATTAVGAALDARTGGNRETPVFLRADRSIDYGALMGVLDALRNAGYLKVALVGLEGAP